MKRERSREIDEEREREIDEEREREREREREKEREREREASRSCSKSYRDDMLLSWVIMSCRLVMPVTSEASLFLTFIQYYDLVLSFSLLFKKKKERGHYRSCLEQISILTGVCGFLFAHAETMALEVRVTRNTPEAGERNGDAEYRLQEDRRMKLAEVQADTGCRAAAVQADIGYRAGGDEDRHGLSCWL